MNLAVLNAELQQPAYAGLTDAEAAALLGKASGLETTTAVYRKIADNKDVISATVDADGNRSAVTLGLT